MTLIKDLIAIPERVHQGDFVLKLSEGVSQAEQTLRDYVVTPQLAEAFDNALGFIQQAVQTRSSKAAYLHGSFGSGKSHFMAVLNLLLSGHLRARAIPELAAAVSRMSWADGKKFLLVPYHMIGSRDMESAVLGQYAEHVRRLHPDAPIPGFYRAEMLFRDANDLRRTLGDTAFFESLGDGTSHGGGWGALESGWDAARYANALAEPPHGGERSRLVGDLIRVHFKAYREIASSGESYVSLDEGLAIMSRHAQALGYDAVILFLDELVLWLASHAADAEFVSREGTKLVKLVEAQNADRPIPLISFVARQRDLRELVGDGLPGAVGVQFSDVLKHWEARFHKITLEDRNLPAIAEKRVLRPVSDAARTTLLAAFDDITRVRKDVFETLLTTQADQDMFRRVYPFSPALVQTLIAVSAALQRERTALKLMLQLLVDRRDDLELGQLIPVGDLWDAIADGDEPFSDAMRVHFDNAKKLWRGRLLPMLEQTHGVTWAQLRAGDGSTAARTLRNDARLLKTLLLAALVPEVESLKALTAQRLAALNHGTLRSPIPGQESQLVLRKVREWASQIGEVKLTSDANPVISIQITGVDLEPVLRAAEGNDNFGNRRKKARELLFQRLGIRDAQDLFLTHGFDWRGTRREVGIVFENVREAADDRLRGRGDDWTVVIDFPFDERDRTPADDRRRLSEYRGGVARTLVWLPSFFGPKAQADLGRYVILDYILQGERFDSYAGHLSLIDREQARNLAKNQRDALRVGLEACLDVAYGIAPEPRNMLQHVLAPDEQFHALDPTLNVRPPVGADFAGAFRDLLGQLFAHRYPAHPEFDLEVKPALLRQIWPDVRAAIEAPGQRHLVADPAQRKRLRSIVNPLRLANMSETHLVIDQYWREHFLRCFARDNPPAMTVAKLREWIDQPQAMGLPLEVQNLLILSFANMTNRRFVLDGKPLEPEVDRINDAATLVEQALPVQADWDAAITRASELFGLTPATSRTAGNVGALVTAVREKAGKRREPVEHYRRALNASGPAERVGTPGDRHQTVDCAASLLAALAKASDAELVPVLARHALLTSPTAVGNALGQAEPLVSALASIQWTLFNGVKSLAEPFAARGAVVLEALANALRNDEHVIALADAIRRAQDDAANLLADVSRSTQPPLPPPPLPPVTVTVAPTPPSPAPPGTVIVAEQAETVLDAAAATTMLDQLRARLASEKDLELTLQWQLRRRAP